MLPAAVFLALLAASPAAALSCLTPNAGETFNELAEAEATYYIGVGTFAVPSGAQGLPEDQTATAKLRFEGELFSRLDTVPFEGLVEVTVTCLDMWCGPDPTSETDQLVFLEAIDDDTMALEEGPCPYRILSAPTAPQRVALFECMEAGLCRDDQIDLFDRK